MESGVEGFAELQRLCSNVEVWLDLQAREATSLMANVASAHEDVLAHLASAAWRLEAEEHTGSGPPLYTRIIESPSPAPPPSAPPPKLAATVPRPVSPPPSEQGAIFPAIATVLAARHRRLRVGHADLSSPQSPSPQVPVLFATTPVESPPRPRQSPPTPLTIAAQGALTAPALSLRRALLRHSFASWRRAGVAALRSISLLLIERGHCAAAGLAMAATFRRLRAFVAQRASREASSAVGRRRALVTCWHRLSHGVGREAAAGWLVHIASEHASRALGTRTLRGWQRWAARATAGQAAAAAISQRRAVTHLAFALRCWRRWLSLRTAWSRRAQRRAEAHGGWRRMHLPCMRAFDGRAIFVEEGSAAMADAYRRRRVAAVVLCRWLAVIFPVDGTGARSRDSEDGMPAP